ncbi:MAG: gliding motility-associated C-terminal domain-containing protein, partial [Paludibacter sp.]|nr:gliding motility-associated C-terminal domain-containing protein [Paludibacter sp.]
TNAQGCDSIATLQLTIKTASFSTTPISICNSALPYNWNGRTYIATGTYQDTLTNVEGCDSIATLQLTVKTASFSTTNLSICASSLPYVWNGKTYNAGGTYKDTLVNAEGCDSIATLQLTVKSASTSTTNIVVCPSSLPYLWNGRTYTATGTYKDTLTNSVGCDSIATLQLTVKAASASTTNIAVCSSSLPYNWNGKTYNAAGTYKDTLVNAQGCDSIATLQLTVNSPSYSTTNITQCSLPYSWHGKTYLITGLYRDTLINVHGCDSIVTLKLTINSPSYSKKTVLLESENDDEHHNISYYYNGKVYKLAGIYVDTLVNAVGCDSIVTLELKVKKIKTPTITSISASICSTDLPYNWHGKNYNTGGTYRDSLLSVDGLDSIVVLKLTVKSSTGSITKVSICPTNLPYSWNKIQCNRGGIYKDTLTNAQGCDSIATLVLTIKSATTSNTVISICNTNLPYSWNGKSYNVGGTYKDTLVNAQGCDSIATLQLTVNLPSYSTTVIDICSANLPYRWNKKDYTLTGIYRDTLANSVGCDSIATLDLTVKPTTFYSTTVDVNSENLPYIYNGKVLRLTGVYKDTLTNYAGCDSILTVDLKVKVPTYSTTKTSICPSELPYNWNGKQYHFTGIYLDTLVNVAGYDSIATLDLKVNSATNSLTRITICPLQLPYLWNNIVCLEAGTYSKGLTNFVGCDSIAMLELHVESPILSRIEVNICTSELPYNWNGLSCTKPGAYNANLKTKAGCDSLATLVLNVFAPTTLLETATISQGENFMFNGTNYTKPGSYVLKLQNSKGCDSIVTLVLKLKVDSVVTNSSVPLEINNTITPNRDGYNDVFMEGWHVKIYNRNGVFLFEGNNGWEGTHNGSPVAKGTYFYVLYYPPGSNPQTKEGFVTVVR